MTLLPNLNNCDVYCNEDHSFFDYWQWCVNHCCNNDVYVSVARLRMLAHIWNYYNKADLLLPLHLKDEGLSQHQENGELYVAISCFFYSEWLHTEASHCASVFMLYKHNRPTCTSCRTIFLYRSSCETYSVPVLRFPVLVVPHPPSAIWSDPSVREQVQLYHPATVLHVTLK